MRLGLIRFPSNSPLSVVTIVPTSTVGAPVDHLTRDRLGEVELALAHYLGVQDAGPPRSS
ncbi:hypothetical protein [Arthrobacter dokdonensis]|uniref:hypothetical protein n=1 Tax=Arthrobacter dokdonellae TaxID=2211210 RepID=UPI0014949417|nr:hypothetical protein [Arthrobacter dokdonellae]